MKIKEFSGKIQPFNWFKGTIFMIIGVLHSRFDVGFNWFLDNLIFGTITYFLFAVSGMLVVLFLKFPREESESKFGKKFISKISFLAIFFIAYGITAFIVFYYKRSILLMILFGIIGIFWILAILYGDNWDMKSILMIIIIGLIVSFGILYGAALNDVTIPVYVYFFFLGVLTLQLSKDILKSCKKQSKEERTFTEYRLFVDIVSMKKAQRSVLGFQVLTLLFLTIPFLTGIYNAFLYFFPMIIATILISISTILNIVYNFEKEYKGSIFILLRLSMFFIIVAYFFGGI